MTPLLVCQLLYSRVTDHRTSAGLSALGGVMHTQQMQVEQTILSGILPVMRSRGQVYLNCRRTAINMLVQQLCSEEEVGFVEMFCWEG